MAHPGQLSAADILHTALELVEEQGSSGISLREAAGRLQVKAPSLYRYFPDKAALERAVVAEGHRLLLEWLLRHDGSADSESAFREMASAYMRFVRRRSALYFYSMERRIPGAETSEPGKKLWNFLLARVGALSGNPDDTSGAVAVWAFLHGFAVLEHLGQFGRSGPRQGFERGLDALIAQSLRLKKSVSAR